MRVYKCDNHNCDWIADRDYSASLNLLGLAEPDVAVHARTKIMPVEKPEPTLFDEAGTRSKTVLSNIV